MPSLTASAARGATTATMLLQFFSHASRKRKSKHHGNDEPRPIFTWSSQLANITYVRDCRVLVEYSIWVDTAKFIW